MTQTHEHERVRALRLWPGIAAVTAQLLAQYVLPVIVPGTGGFAVIAGMLGAVAVLVWWLFFSRAPIKERFGVLLLMAVAMLATRPLVDRSIATGMMGMMFAIVGIPVLGVALVAWAVTTRRTATRPRYALLIAFVFMACGLFLCLRTDGMTGEGRSQFAWRWSTNWEERLLAKAASSEVAALPVAARLESPPPAVDTKQTPEPKSTEPPSQTVSEWPGFRGPQRDGRVIGVRIKTDWASTPPVQLWRREVGPGWSSVAIADGRVYTQEQRGEFEVVASYKLATGEPVWAHRDTARFWESNAGAGPRGTPTLDAGRVYTFGATGIVNALNASDGRLVWTRNAASDTGAKVPEWGFSSSPLVVGDSVFVAAAGRVIAYDCDTGTPRWKAPEGGISYSSPHLVMVDGVAHVVMLDNTGITSFAPADGSILWKHSWPGGSPIVQPAVVADGSVLITTTEMGVGAGSRRLTVAHGPAGWKAEEVWTSKGLKPYFNDFVVHKGHAYGFDGSILASIDLKDGARKWKGGRYGHGQLLLLAEQDLLLVLSEEGELALVTAAPDQFKELSRFPALHEKTWNHPALAGDVLLVRNGQEMIAFRLPASGI